ncbi:hypothetical protein LK542_06520 [Massilia sp. IC2-477]|uniref:hypothetical protein n=1 Tax=unclassified Massilia TaxID=2609279 RepID=UPI001D11CDD0|nr:MULTISPECIES: hypothetical protein [unclassified Massilia]MCC2955267.1 hypothetical protein [Massilia sp. IC2-477]MCC2972506.1 hypothetical protein [Massilia sp. IC2-476]
MHMLFRLFGPRRRKNQEEIASRAAEVIAQVLFDVGLDRFLAGTVLLDRQFRLHFYAAPPVSSRSVLAAIAMHELDEARVFRSHVLGAGIDAPTLACHTRIMADGIMRELRARSPALCALPATRRERRLGARPFSRRS